MEKFEARESFTMLRDTRAAKILTCFCWSIFSFPFITEGKKHDLYVLLIVFDVRSSHSLSEYVSVFTDNFGFNDTCNLYLAVRACSIFIVIDSHVYPSSSSNQYYSKRVTSTDREGSSVIALSSHTLVSFLPCLFRYFILVQNQDVRHSMYPVFLLSFFLFLLPLLLSLSWFRSPVFLPLISSCSSWFCPLSC